MQSASEYTMTECWSQKRHIIQISESIFDNEEIKQIITKPIFVMLLEYPIFTLLKHNDI